MMQLTSFTVRTWDLNEIEFRRQPVLDHTAYVALYLVKPVNRGLMGVQIDNPMRSTEEAGRFWNKIEQIAVLIYGKKTSGELNAEKADLHGLSESVKRLLW